MTPARHQISISHARRLRGQWFFPRFFPRVLNTFSVPNSFRPLQYFIVRYLGSAFFSLLLPFFSSYSFYRRRALSTSNFFFFSRNGRFSVSTFLAATMRVAEASTSRSNDNGPRQTRYSIITLLSRRKNFHVLRMNYLLTRIEWRWQTLRRL